jgi:hypothetical protein
MAESPSDSALLRYMPLPVNALRLTRPMVYQIAALGASCRAGAVSVKVPRAVHVFPERLWLR